MEGQLGVPFHFATEFLVLVVAIGAAFDSLRARRLGAGGWSLAQAFGFLCLAAAQVAHGASIAEAEGDPVVIGLRAAGFAVLALSAQPAFALVSAAGAGAAAPALFVPGVDAPWAAVAAAGAVATAVRGTRAHRMDQHPSTFAFAAAFVAFAVAEAAVVVSPPSGGTWLAVAHAARALGALFLARWLWTSIVRSVRMRFIASFAIMLTVAVLILSAVLNLIIGTALEREEIKRLEDAGAARVASIRTLSQSAFSTAGLLAPTTTLLEGLRTGDQTRYDQAAGLLQDADVMLFMNRTGRVLASVDNARAPAQPGPLSRSYALSLAGSDVVAEALETGRGALGPVRVSFVTPQGASVTQLVALAAAPRRSGSGRVAGALAVGYRIDQAFLEQVATDTGAEVTVVLGEAGTTTFENPAAVAGAIDPLLDGPLREARERRTAVRRLLVVGGREYLTVFVPVRTEDNQVIAMMALSRQSLALAQAQRDYTRTVFLVTLLALAVAAALAWLSGGRVTRPIRALTAAARALREGELGARAQVASADEVGALGAAFNEMAEELQRKTAGLRDAAVAEGALRARMEAIVQSMGDGLIAIDADGRIVTFNRAAERMTGRRADRAVGRRIGDVVSGGVLGGRSLAEAAMAGGVTEGRLARADGAAIPVAMTSAPLVGDDGEQVGRVVLVRDTSREHEAERMKSEFLSNVSHELRTPITPIKGYAEIMKRKKFPREKAEQFLEGILESTERLERIVEILVDFAAIEAGRLKPRSEPIPIGDLIDPALTRWRARAGSRRFVRKGAAGLPPVLGDPRLLERSLDELIDNAVKFSPDGGTIEIGAEPVLNGARTRRPKKLRITVRDHGIGIEPERMPDLFQDFRQLDGSETRTYGGLGLGLAYVKRIASVHGGDVLVQSKPGRGSVFSLVLPVAEAKKEAGTASPRLRAARAPAPVAPSTARARGAATRKRPAAATRTVARSAARRVSRVVATRGRKGTRKKP